MRIVFVADYFQEDMNGGSERSLQALIDAAPVPVEKVRSVDFNPSEYTRDDFVIFGNFANLALARLPEIRKRLQYAVIESDFKYCLMRSPELHAQTQGKCDCDENDYGTRIFGFYFDAVAVFWKSHIHMNRHFEAFPALEVHQNVVLSATYTKDDIEYLLALSAVTRRRNFRRGWAVFKTDNWIKGYQDAVDYCARHKLARVDIGKGSWHDTMKKLSRCEGLVFLPRGMESCSRITIEARMLGLDVAINGNVPVAKEIWFNQSVEQMAEYLKGRPEVFWTVINANITCPA